MIKEVSHPENAAYPQVRSSRSLLTCFWLAGTVVFMISLQLFATCSVDTQSVNFGSYDSFTSQNLEGVGNISVTCSASTSYTIGLSQGNGSYAARLMTNGSSKLVYNLYTSLTQTAVWGDGTSGTALVEGSGTTMSYPVYGIIPAEQTPPVGVYSDAVTVTVTF